MKLYACNWHGYTQCQSGLHDSQVTMVKNCITWQDALVSALHEVKIDFVGWKEEEPLCKTVELSDIQYEKWILTLLYQEQKKPLPTTFSSLEEDRLFQKVNDGLVKSDLAIMWEPQAYLPVSESCVFDFADPDEEAMCFGDFKTYYKKIRSLQEESTAYLEVMKVLKFVEANHLMLILENETGVI